MEAQRGGSEEGAFEAVGEAVAEDAAGRADGFAAGFLVVGDFGVKKALDAVGGTEGFEDARFGCVEAVRGRVESSAPTVTNELIYEVLKSVQAQVALTREDTS